MEIDRSVYTDLIFHIFAHMKVNNASDTYDEAYVTKMEKELSRKTVILESVTAYYCANFERLAFVNFLPYFMARSVDEVCYMISQEVLEECEKSLSDERKNKMKEIFEKTS